MNTRTHRALGVLTAATLLAGMAVIAPVVIATPAQAAPTPAPMSHTLDYLLVSSTGNTGFLTNADLQARTDQVSQAWKRMSRGVVTEVKMGRVATLPNYSGTFCYLSKFTLPDAIQTALGYSPDVYLDQENGRHLAIVATGSDASSCPWTGNTIAMGDALSSSGIFLVKSHPDQPTTDAMAIAHELGHVFGLKHAGAVNSTCATAFWDGPFLATSNAVAADGCPGRGQFAEYMDSASIMGNSLALESLDINGVQKYTLGLIQPGAGLQNVTPTAAEQLITIHDSATQDRNLLQSVRLTSDDPDGSGPCTEPVYQVDYNLQRGGVQILRVPTSTDCGTKQIVSAVGSVAWSTPAGSDGIRTVFLPGESRVTQDGKVQIRVVSVDSTAGTAMVGIRRTDAPGFSTVQLTAQDLGSGNQQQVGPTGGQLMARVTTNQPTWSARSDQSWAAASPAGTSGGDVVVTVQPNPTAQPRTAVITVQAGTATTMWTVIQQAGPSSDDCGASSQWSCGWPDLASPAQGRIETAGDSDWFAFSPPVKGTWTFVISAGGGLTGQTGTVFYPSGASLATTTAALGNNQVRITADLDNGWTYYVQVAATGASAGTYTITATQPAANIALSRNDWSAAEAGDTLGLTVTSNTLWQLGPLPGWLHTDYTHGSATRTVEVDADPNMSGKTRTGSVTFNVAGQAATLSVTQPAANCAAPEICSILVSPTWWPAPASGGTQQIAITSNAAWQLDFTASGGTPTWVTADSLSGPGSGTMTLTVAANTTGQPRTAYANFRVSGAFYPVIIDQDPVTADDCGDTASTACAWPNLGTPASGRIETAGDVDWFKITPDATGTWVFTSSPQAVNGLSDPIGTVFSADGVQLARNDNVAYPTNTQFQVSLTLTVGQTYYLQVQANGTLTGGYTVTATRPVVLSLSQGSWSAPAGGGDLPVDVTSNVAWQVTATAGVSVSQSSGSGNGRVTVTASPNPGTASRTMTVTFTGGGLTAGLSVNQGGQTSTDDCGNTASTACVWPNLGTPVSGRLETAGDQDWFRFTPTTGGTWVFTSSPQAVNGLADPIGTLFSADGTQLARNDDIANPTNMQFQVSWTLTAGQTYYLRVQGYGTGGYTVAASQPTPPVEPQLLVQPGVWWPVADGGTQTVQVTSNLDWKVTVPAGVTASRLSGTGNGSVVLTAAPNPGTTARDVSVTFTGGGLTSTIKGSQAGQPGTLHDCGRTSLTLCSWLTLNTPIMGSIDAPGDVQWFIFTAPASGTWVFTSSAPASGALPDPRAWVLTGDGTTQLGYNDDANYPSDLQFRVSANLMATQPYKIMVSGYGGQTGGYTITATPPGGLVDDCGNTPTTACAWPDLTKPMSGRLEMLEDVDWFRITPSVSGTWTFTSSGGAPDGVRDPVGFLYAADGTTRIAYNNDVDNPSNLQFQLSATLTAGQTYYLRVSAYTSQLNCGYTITATRG